MFNKRTTPTVIDLLFNLVLTFGLLFALSFVLIKDATTDSNIQNDNNILISIRWDLNCDVDLWLLLPDGRKVFFGNRDEPPAHLDVDVVAWRYYRSSTGELRIIKNNEEIITIRSILEGEYAVNAHFYSPRGEERVTVDVLVQDAKNRNTIYSGTKELTRQQTEQHFVRFKVRRIDGGESYAVTDIYEDRPLFFVGN